jgi:hypothetical protein
MTAVAGILRPSGAPRWAGQGEPGCPGSFVLEQLFPEDEDSPEAREGTAGHFYVTEAVQGRFHPIGTVTPNGHPIDAEMVECGQSYVADVSRELGEAARYPTPSAFGVEQKLTMRRWIHPDCEGTPDTFLLNLAARRLVVWDYKYGHRYVDPYRHPQMVSYVAGVFEAYDLEAADVADLEIIVRVVQPRNYSAAGPIREWRTTGAVILEEIARLRAAALAAKTPSAPTLTGSHCRDCSAIHACEANRRMGGYAMDVAGRSTPDVMPPDALGLELRNLDRALKRLEARRDGLATVALDAINKGANVPYWSRGFGKGRERWVAPLPEVFAMGDMLGVELRKPAALTPNQARDAGVDASVIAAYSETPTGAAKLVPVDDNRAVKAFSAVGTNPS